MPSLKQVQAAALLLASSFSAVYAEQQPPEQKAEPAVLTPFVPGNLDLDHEKSMLPVRNRTLYFGGSSSNQRGKSAGTTVAAVGIDFKYDNIAIDQTNFINDVSCTADGTLRAIFSDADAFKTASAKWPKEKLLLISSTAGCGLEDDGDDDNGYLLADTIKWSEDDLSILAAGAFKNIKDLHQGISAKWGASQDPSSGKLSKRDESVLDFEMSPQIAAGLSKGKEYEQARADQNQEDTPGAPWAHSYKMWEIKSDPDAGWNGGMTLYCVDCKVNGALWVGGDIVCNAIPPFLHKAELNFWGNFHAGLYLGFDAHLNYEKEWSKELMNVPLAGWVIKDVIEVGPYISLSIDASFKFNAQGTLIAGGAIDFPDFGVDIDLLDLDNSNAHGFEPQLSRRFEVEGELHTSASLGLPVALGVQLAVAKEHDWGFDGHVAIVDRPSLNAQADMSLEYENSGSGWHVEKRAIEANTTGTGLGALVERDECYGVSWRIWARNQLYFEAGDKGEYLDDIHIDFRDDSFDIADGCINFNEPRCKGSVAWPAPVVPAGSGVMCNKHAADFSWDKQYKRLNNIERNQCARTCLRDEKCKGIAYLNDQHACHLLNAPYKDIAALPTADLDSWNIFDEKCFETASCVRSTDTQPLPMS